MRVAAVVPARNAAGMLSRCLAAIRESGGDDVELVVVDDGSTDRTSDVAGACGATVLRLDTAGGPAAARNHGARATTAEVLLFVDADVLIAPDVIPRLTAAFDTDAALAAVFGSYDAHPASGSFVSDYRNLLHHFTHQHSREDSGSFWAGCGAVRRSVFTELSGFDERYRRPSIEDIEFGARVRSAGHAIRLDKQLLCRHLKRWTLTDILRVDIRDRAYPWARLMFTRGDVPADLNLRWAHRVSAGLVWMAGLSVLVALLGPGGATLSLGVGAAALGAVVWLNRRFYGWLVRRRGLWFSVRAFPLHLLYYAYSSATFAWAWVRHAVSRRFDSAPKRRVDRHLVS